MTMVWGDWEYSGGNGMRVGVDYSWGSVSSGSSTATLYYTVYTENQYRYADPQTLNCEGQFTYGFNNDSYGGAVARYSSSFTYTYGSGNYGSSPGNYYALFYITDTYNGVVPLVRMYAPIPARPYAAPAAPSGVTTTRISDQQARANWTNNATSQAPYTSLYVEFQRYSGNAWGPWTAGWTLSGGTTSLTQSGLTDNGLYNYRVRASNSVGTSAWAYASTQAWMTPAASTEVASSLGASGSSIVTTWRANNWTGTTPEPKFSIERSVAGGAWTSVATGLSGTTWTDTSPGGGNNQYRVASTITVFGSTLTSTWATGNVVSTVVPPLAPTQLSPNGVAFDFSSGPVTLTWKHNPGADNAAQSKFWIERSADNGTTWVAVASDVASADSTYTGFGGSMANGTTYQWRVWTQGASTAAAGPKSAVATIIGRKTPTLALTQPPATLTALPLKATWTFTQEQGDAQAAWEATLYAADGVTVLESRTGSGTALTTTFTYPVQDGQTYVVRVRARSAQNQWTATASRTTTISLPLPAVVTTAGAYDECSGSVSLALAALAPAAGETAVQSVTVERRIAGEETWTKLVSGLTLPATFVDVLPSTVLTNQYRVTALSAAPSYRTYPTVEVTPPSGAGCALWVFLSYGDAFLKTLRFRGSPEISEEVSRLRETRHFLGRRRPVLLMGNNTTRTVNVSGVLMWNLPNVPAAGCGWDSPAREWLEAGLNAEVVCYRDYTGRRVFGMLSPVQASDGVPRRGTVSFSVTETEYTERYGVV